MSINVRFDSFGQGKDCFSGKEGEVFTLAFEDGTVEGPLTMKSLAQILRMKLGKNGKATNFPEAAAVNGTV